MTAERRLAAQLFALAFCVLGVPRVFTQTAAHALFIEAHGAAAMPWAYAAEALAVPLAGALYIAASRRVGLATLWRGTLALQVVALVLLRGALAAGWSLAPGAAIVWFEIEFVLSSLVAWGMAHQLMTLRQGKRWFGWVAAGEPAAVIGCGLATPLLLQVMAPADLLWLSAAGAAAGSVLAGRVLRRHAPVEEEEPTPASAQVRNGRSRYVWMLVAMVALGQLGYFFVDAAFYLEAGRAYPGAHELATFLGLYSAAVGAASLAASLLLSPWLLARHGVKGGLLVLPLLLLAGAIVTLAGAPGWLLGCVVVNKVLDQSLRYTVDKSTFITLLQPLPPLARVRAQAALEGIVEPLAGGAAALGLWGLYAAFGASALVVTAAVAGVAGTWALLALWQVRGYRRLLALSVQGDEADAPAVAAAASSLQQRLSAELDAPVAGAAERERRIDACWRLLAAADQGIAALHAQYRQGGAAARARVLELLELRVAAWLAPGQRQRLLALMEAHAA